MVPATSGQVPGVGVSGLPQGLSQETDTPLSECTITIDRPLVHLMSEANQFSPAVLEVRSGDYGATVYRLVSFGGGHIKQGWFQIQVEGRTGWINSEAIGAKTSGCP